ncbi:hypothetical protein [Xylella fastidiosa]|uniref:hypothetical protein n=1 Tax=Xylella fastidiosa TaxID=2371 RepID=UPI0034E0262F
MIRRSLAFLCDSGGCLQKSGNVDCDPVIRSAALLKRVIKRMSRRIGHLLPVACGEAPNTSGRSARNCHCRTSGIPWFSGHLLTAALLTPKNQPTGGPS